MLKHLTIIYRLFIVLLVFSPAYLLFQVVLNPPPFTAEEEAWLQATLPVRENMTDVMDKFSEGLNEFLDNKNKKPMDGFASQATTELPQLRAQLAKAPKVAAFAEASTHLNEAIDKMETGAKRIKVALRDTTPNRYHPDLISAYKLVVDGHKAYYAACESFRKELEN